MKQEEHTYWQIHDFLKGKLKGEELQKFQEQMAEDPTLQEEVAKHRIANQLVIQNRLQLAKQVSLDTQIQYKKEILYKKIGMGVGLASLVGILLFFGFRSEREISLATSKQETQKESTKAINNESIKEAKTEVSKEKNAEIIRKPVGTTSPEKNQRRSGPSVEIPQQIEKEKEAEKMNPLEVHSMPKSAEEKPMPISLPKKEEVITKVEKSCADIKIKATISTTNACSGDNNGSITASRFQGGVAPYHYEVQSHAHSQVLSNSALPLGTYVVLITDAHHCTTKIDNVVIKGVICEEEERAFNPFLDEVLELPAYSGGGTFVVHEKNGNVFYKKEIVQGEKIEWNGMSTQGQLEAGHFFYEIQYHDGTRKQGTITITR